MTDAVEIVSDLVKIPSVSPFGRNETERRERFERCREVLAYLEEFLQKQGGLFCGSDYNNRRSFVQKA